jgi:hypothetical protein
MYAICVTYEMMIVAFYLGSAGDGCGGGGSKVLTDPGLAIVRALFACMYFGISFPTM